MPLFGPDAIARHAAIIAQAPDDAATSTAVAAPPSTGIGWAPYAALLGSNAADLGTSLYGMNHGLHEGNPLMGGDKSSVAMGKVLPALAGLISTKLLADSGHTRMAKIAAYASSVPPSIAALHNYQLIRQQKQEP
jgi:hypothetical protein